MTDVVYLTQDKHDEIVAELEHRKTTLRREIADKIGKFISLQLIELIILKNQ